MAFAPAQVTAGGKPLALRRDLAANGYEVKPLTGGDWILSIRHDGYTDVLVEGDDPQQVADDTQLRYEGDWSVATHEGDLGGRIHVASPAGASVSFTFTGNQVRLVGAVGPDGGKAQVYLDDVKQLVGIDCWCPQQRRQQILYYKNGLKPGTHTLKVVAQGNKNALSQGAQVWVDALQWSTAEGDSGFGEGGGPTTAQRVIFGYPSRTDYVDSRGNEWRPATEFIVRLGKRVCAVTNAWWIEPRTKDIANTPDPELYRYGIHARDVTAYFTVGPGRYHTRIKLAETRETKLRYRLLSIELNGEPVVDGLDIAATAGGLHRAVDIVFNDVEPRNGVIAIRLKNRHAGEAIVQGIEVGPGHGGRGAPPVVVNVAWDPELLNPGFEDGVRGATGSSGSVAGG